MRICAALTAAMILLAVGTANAATVLVTGSNRGLGYEFAKQYAERGYDVIATCRTPAEADDLKALATQHRNVTIEELDVTDQGEIDALAAKYEGTPIDILINNAGIMGSPADQAIGSLDYALFRRTMDTNVYGVMAVTSAFRENVKASDQKKVIAITSVAGSMTGPWENIGGIYFYRASKAALNNVMRAMGIDLR
ncbi:MAG: SDR family NAD(P)-dependent oxidoreductase, partial [Rhodospirillaceae bacterium]